MKFDIPIPEWANWVAQDEDGEWWVYDTKPRLCERTNGPLYWCNHDNARREKIPYPFDPPEDCTQELYEIVWK
jgi:hypothetical protein